jgi:hypothetical protein
LLLSNLDIGVIDGNETTTFFGLFLTIQATGRRRGHSSLHAFVFLRREENLPNTTGRLRYHDTTGALRPKLPAASVDYIPTFSRPLMEFPIVSKKKAVRKNQ